jgi:hypothetical protein
VLYEYSRYLDEVMPACRSRVLYGYSRSTRGVLYGYSRSTRGVLNGSSRYLDEVVPACRRRADDFKLKAIQALAFVRYKESRYSRRD